MKRSRIQRRSIGRAIGFTLVELMVSLALVALLVLGINEVFRIASRGVSAGQALSTVQRDNRTGHAVIFGDLKNAVMPPNPAGGAFDNGPCFIIRSERVYAFRNRQDHLSDADTQALVPPPTTNSPENPTDATISTRDLNDNNVETDVGEVTKPATYNDRSHRIDQLLFFARGSMRRQTGGILGILDPNDPYVSQMTCAEGMIWYGHLALPDFTSKLATNEKYIHRIPGERPYTSNKENFYASNWILGRVQMLMKSQDANGDILDKPGGNKQDYISHLLPSNPNYYNTLYPFAPDSPDASGTYSSQWHRFDLAWSSIDEFRDVIQNYTGASPWYTTMTSARFQANPIPDRPLTAHGVARTAPVFLRGCSQFAVEFTGDFVTQNNDPNDIDFISPTDPTPLNGRFGDVVPVIPAPATGPPVVPDGVPDFVVVWDDTNNNGKIDTVAEAATMRKVTRWYGMPRDVDGDGIIHGWVANRTARLMRDVVPLRDVISSGINAVYVPPPGYVIERFAASGTPQELDPVDNYADPAGALVPPSSGMVSQAQYFAAWAPPGSSLAPKPTMLRIVISLDDPNATMAAEQNYEYVIELP